MGEIRITPPGELDANVEVKDVLKVAGLVTEMYTLLLPYTGRNDEDERSRNYLKYVSLLRELQDILDTEEDCFDELALAIWLGGRAYGNTHPVDEVVGKFWSMKNDNKPR